MEIHNPVHRDARNDIHGVPAATVKLDMRKERWPCLLQRANAVYDYVILIMIGLIIGIILKSYTVGSQMELRGSEPPAVTSPLGTVLDVRYTPKSRYPGVHGQIRVNEPKPTIDE